MIKEILKNSPFKALITKMADIIADPASLFLLKELTRAKTGTAILIGTPCHHNLGDHLIASNEKRFLTQECSFTKVIEIPTRIFLHNKKKIIKHISADLPVFVTGGGWMGDIWPEDQEILEIIISAFNMNDVIILPQTVYYSDLNSCQNAIHITNGILSNIPSLTLFCRDQLSYDTVLEVYKNNVSNVFLCPDIGLYREPVKGTTNNKVVRCCLRNDRELIITNELREFLTELESKIGYKIIEDSTIARGPVSVWKRERKLNSIINRFHNSTLIVTDRLHGMVFAAIANTKCIAFDNKTHKVSGVYNLWLKNNPNIRLIASPDNLSLVKSEIIDLLFSKPEMKQEEYFLTLKPAFAEMASEIMTIINNRKV